MKQLKLGLFVAALVACSAPVDSESLPYRLVPASGGGISEPLENSCLGTAGGAPGVGGASTGVAGRLSTAGAGGASALAMPNAFTGAAPFASAPIAQSAKSQMTTNPTKTQCLTCHNGEAGVSLLLAAGTVFLDAAGTEPAVDYEVRVVDTSTNAVFSAHTDADGNFWIPPGMTADSGPFMIGVRNGTEQQAMPVLQRGLECNGSACHGGPQGPIHLR